MGDSHTKLLFKASVYLFKYFAVPKFTVFFFSFQSSSPIIAAYLTTGKQVGICAFMSPFKRHPVRFVFIYT